MKKFLSTVLAVSVVASTVAAFGLSVKADDLIIDFDYSNIKGNMQLAEEVYTHFDEGEESGIYATYYKYDKNDKCIETSNSYEKGIINVKNENIYNEQGKSIKGNTYVYNSDKKELELSAVNESEYNENGKVVKLSSKNVNEAGQLVLSYTEEVKYDEKGEMTGFIQTNYDSEGKLENTREVNYEYEDNHIDYSVEEIRKDSKGEVVAKYLTENLFNDKKLVEREVYYEADEQGEYCAKSMYEYTYDANGNKIEEILSIDDEGTFLCDSKWEYEYDANNRRISAKVYIFGETDWELSDASKRVYTNTTNGYSVVGYDINVETEEEVQTAKKDYTVDKYGNVTGYTDYVWDEELTDWEKTGVKTYSYITKAVKIVDGEKQTVDAATAKELVFRSTADILDFVKVVVDGKDVDTKFYTVTSGSTIITFNESFIKTLANGEHTVAIVSTTGNAETSFTVAKKVSPATGDTMEIALFSAILVASAVACTVVLRKKEN